MDIETIDKECLIEASERMDIDRDTNVGNELRIVTRDEFEGEDALTPEDGMEFVTQDDAYRFYKRYALKMGFKVRWSSTHTSKVDKSKTIGRKIVCNKQGGKKESRTSNRREMRTWCDAEMIIRLTDSGNWRVSRFVSQHNHIMCTPSKISKHRPHKKKIHRQLVVHNHLRLERKNNLGNSCVMIVNHFMKKSEDDGFFFKIEVADDYTPRSVFWADRKSRESYKKFSDVIIFDVTYRTSSFSLPFAPFTGINHHGQSSLFGCALLADETEDTYVWLFEQWLTCMRGIEPTIIITDQDAAMGNAIKRVFPKTLHRYCDWHLDKNIADKLQCLKTTHGDDFELYFNKLRSSDSTSEAEKCWDELTTKYDLRGVRWLSNLWENKESWVHCYLKDKFFASTHTSQRSESINSFFDTYVTSSTPPHEFVVQYDKALTSRRRAEEDADFKTMNSKPLLTMIGWSLEKEASKRYTLALFNMLHAQMKDGVAYWTEKIHKEGTIITYKVGRQLIDKSKWKIVTYDSDGVVVSCQCKHFESIGLLCRHAFCILWKKQITKIPDRYVLKRWTTDCRFESLDVELENDVAVEVDDELLWGVRYKMTKVLENAYKSHTSALEVDRWLTNLMDADNGQSSHFDGDVPLVSQSLSNTSLEINIRDPSEVVKNKGRSKLITKISSALEKAQDSSNKRTCGYCGEKGHYRTGCPKAKEMERKERDG